MRSTQSENLQPATWNLQPLDVRAAVAYDGTDFQGFQLQRPDAGAGQRPEGKGGRTVQGALEAALATVTQQPVRVIGSGRTDSGVHARGQVIGFRVEWRHTLADLQRALNAVLPEDVVVWQLGPAEPEWHPRFSARRRYYNYSVLNRPLRSPLDRRYAHLVVEPLDLAALQAAADLLVGEHDFASFGQPTHTWPEASKADSTVRIIYNAGWQQEGERFTFDVVGNAFLRSMVRSLVGTMLQVGMGRWPVARVAEVLASRDRGLAAAPAPACGLCLMKVEYA